MESKLDLFKFLPQIHLFRGVAAEELLSLTTACRIIRLARGEDLFTQGSPAKAFYIVVYGKVMVYRLSKDGREQPIHFHNERDVVAEAAVFDQKIFPSSCRAQEETLIVELPRDRYIELIYKRPEIALKLLAAYSMRLREFVHQVEMLSLDDVRVRLLKYLEKHCENIDGTSVVNLRLSKRELASLLGTVPETLSRNLKKLKEEGVIEEEEKRIVILDPNRIKNSSE